MTSENVATKYNSKIFPLYRKQETNKDILIDFNSFWEEKDNLQPVMFIKCRFYNRDIR